MEEIRLNKDMKQTKNKSWEPTSFLRWARHDLKTHHILVLEQLWINVLGDESEWREIPTEDVI